MLTFFPIGNKSKIYNTFLFQNDKEDNRVCLLGCPSCDCSDLRCCGDKELLQEAEDYYTYRKAKQPETKMKPLTIDVATVVAKSQSTASPNHYVADPTASDQRKPKRYSDSSIEDLLAEVTSTSESVLDIPNGHAHIF